MTKRRRLLAYVIIALGVLAATSLGMYASRAIAAAQAQAPHGCPMMSQAAGPASTAGGGCPMHQGTQDAQSPMPEGCPMHRAAPASGPAAEAAPPSDGGAQGSAPPSDSGGQPVS